MAMSHQRPALVEQLDAAALRRLADLMGECDAVSIECGLRLLPLVLGAKCPPAPTPISQSLRRALDAALTDALRRRG